MKKDNVKFTDEQEIEWSETDADFIAAYAVKTKKSRLCKKAELNICNKYLHACKTIKKNQKNALHNFFQYVKLVKTVPKQKEFLKYLSSDCLSIYAVCTRKPLPKTYEKKLFSYVLKNKDDTALWDLTEYQYLIKTKLPEEIHNFILAKSLTENMKIGPIPAYFLNLQKIKNLLVTISERVGEDINLKDLIKMY